MKKFILILILFGALYSCKIGKNYKGTEFVQPTAYAQKDSTAVVVSDTVNTDSLQLEIADLAWWNMFDDPVLDSLIYIAFENNRNVLIAAENVLQARYALKIQNKEFLPKFDITGQGTRGNFVLNNIGETSNIFIGAASVNWELDLWGKLRRQSEAARADLVASEYGYRGIMVSLISDVTTTYFQLIQAKTQLEISKRNAFSRDSMLHIIEARYDKGIVPKLDVNQAEIQKAIAAGAVPQFELRVIQLENSLSILIGQNPGPIAIGKMLEEQRFEMQIPDVTPVDLLAQRPDVIAAEYNLIAQNARVGAAQGNRLPSISVTGLLGVAGNELSNISLSNPLWNLGGQIVGPLFYWGQLKRQVDIEKSRRYQAFYQYENTVFNALKEVEDVLAEIRTTRTEINIAEARRNAAVEAETLSKERYSKGVTSYLEFLEQQRQSFDAQLLLEELRAQLLSAYVRYYKALGGGWLTEEEKKAAEAAEAEQKND
jgi:multidrug efflux system outer membrane protein